MCIRDSFSAGDLENAEILARRGLVETKELEPPRAVVLNRMIAAVRFHDSDYAGAEEAFVAAAKAHPAEQRANAKRSLLSTPAHPETCLARLRTRLGSDHPDEWPDWAREADCRPLLDDPTVALC